MSISSIVDSPDTLNRQNSSEPEQQAGREPGHPGIKQAPGQKEDQRNERQEQELVEQGDEEIGLEPPEPPAVAPERCGGRNARNRTGRTFISPASTTG